MSIYNPEKDTYQDLTRATFIVLDTETTWVPDGKPQRLISYAYATISNGRHTATTTDQLINPGVTVASSSTNIHGIRTEDLQDKPTFADTAERITRALTRPGAVLVCHNAVFDVAVLRNEYKLAGLTLPDIPVLDTMPLPASLGYAPEGLSARPSLLLLTQALGVKYQPEEAHKASTDATATAKVLIALLRHAATHGTAHDITSLLAEHGSGTTNTLTTASGYIGSGRTSHTYELPVTHLMRHKDAPTKGSIAVTEWLARGRECAQLLCPYLTEEAEAINPKHRNAFFNGLFADIDTLTEPGQLATLIGTTMRMLSASMNPRQEINWWRRIQPHIHKVPRCNFAEQCPDCRDGKPCPIDVAHEYAAESLLRDKTGQITDAQINKFLSASDRSLMLRLSGSNPRLGGHAAETVIRHLQLTGDHVRAELALGYAHAQRLNRHDPRLAVRVAYTLVGRNQHDEAIGVLTQVERPESTNPADIAVFAAKARIQADQAAHNARTQAHEATRRRTPTKARPASRVRPNPWRP